MARPKGWKGGLILINSITEFFKNIVKSRLFPMIIAYVLLFSILIGRMFYLQIIHGDEYEQESTFRDTKSREIKSARGKIYDCNGVLLASNEQTYAITLEDTGELEASEDKNQMIIKMVRILSVNNEKIDLEFPISIDRKGKKRFTVEKAAELRFKKDIFYCKSVNDLTDEQKKMSAADVFDYLRYSKDVNTPKFMIDDPEKEPLYTDKEALAIMNVRYAMLMNTYKKYVPITIAANVSPTTVAAIKESQAELPGVDVTEELNRVYYESEYFAHIIGYTGLISSDTLAQMQDEDPNTPYTQTDYIGKTGIEKEYENILRGTKGSEDLVINNSSRIVDVKNRQDSIPGNDIYLTIDSKYQKAYYKILEKKIAGILLSRITNSSSAGTKGKSATGILIPINDVYYAILQNSIVDVNKFSEPNASGLEKYIYNKYKENKRITRRKIRNQLSYSNTLCGDDISDTMQTYLDHIYYDLMVGKGLILSDELDRTDPVYIKFTKNKIAFSSFLKNAINKNWINLALLDVGKDYYSTDEIYNILVKYIMNMLNDDNDFTKLIYKTMVYNDTITGGDICRLLFEQNILKNKNNTKEKLESGQISAYSFIRSKIRSLEITPGQLGLEPCSGSLVVTDVNTGKIKAMVSYPSYDNNMFANSVDYDYYTMISTNKAAPLMNRATQQKTAPGSTYKMLSSACGLEENVINPHSTIRDKHTFSKITKPYPNCWSGSSHGLINVSQALRDSCNYFFYELGYRFGNGKKDVVNNESGLKKLKKYADVFGLTETSGVELSEADPKVSDTDVVRSAIGQGTNSYTPIQLSRYVTTIANEGTCYNLTIIDKITDVTNGATNKNNAKVRNKVDFKPSTWKAIESGMRMVVRDGSIKRLFENLPVEVAGKTGTAQESKSKPNHALFVSYAPYEHPEISVTAVIANGYTSSNAAELASDVYKYYYDKKSRKRLMTQKVSGPKMDSHSLTD